MGLWCCLVAKHPALSLFSPVAQRFRNFLLKCKQMQFIQQRKNLSVSTSQMVTFSALVCLKLAIECKPYSAARNFKCTPMNLFEKVIAQCGRTNSLI